MENTNKYWLSIEQWRQDPEFAKLAEQEFMSSPLQSEDGKDGWARREFLKLMGASLALTSFGCMRRPAQMIVPYAKKPKEIIHGLSNYYASAFFDGGEVFGTLVTTRDGRPIKIEGNPDFPTNKGGMSARAHASILSLYDPERLNGPRRNLQNDKKTNRETITVSWENLDAAVKEQLKKGSVGILTGSLVSPSTQKLLAEFARKTNASTYTWDTLNYSDLRQAQELSYGRAQTPRYRFDRAKYVLAVNNDFLGVDYMATANTKAFASKRKPGPEMAKLVSFESLMSLTGSNADERYRLPSGHSVTVLMGLAHDIIVKKKATRYAGDSQVLKALEPFANVESELKLEAGTLARIAAELLEVKGSGLVVAGGWQSGASTLAAQIAANFLNSALENEGKTVEAGELSLAGIKGTNQDLQKLIADLDSGKLKTLIIHATNPGYATLNTSFAAAVKKAEMVIYTGDRVDETGVFADFIAPDHHALENWDDVEAISGIYAIQQPTIEPLYQTRSFQESLLTWMGAESTSWYDYLKQNWRNTIYASNRSVVPANKDFEDFWIAVLHSGVFATKSLDRGAAPRSFSVSSLGQVTPVGKTSGYQLELFATVGIRDGSLANVAWLQEFPDPVTKICWDNYLTVSPSDAAQEKWHEGDMVSLKVGDKQLNVPVHIQPGQADGVLGLAVGYGRTRAGKVANGVGQNAFALASLKDGRLLTSGLACEAKKTGQKYALACTQGHHSMEGRQIVVEATLEQFQKDAGANIHRHKMFTMWDEHKYPNNKWGMVIDLNSCTGCGSCVIACQSENNIPTVGKKHVLSGREMHWIRIDRYYVGEPNDPAVVHQPIVCMHCDNAPCETVCPVMATVHSDEGTNDMIYNRCVGTRYCSNNCPYKVRRFNWFNNVKTVEKPLNYAMNPDVTVRARGVMEKCTFCIHRIRSVKSQAKLKEQTLKDGDVKTACQQSCPADAIVFGDLNDSESQVRKMFDAAQSYTLLEELNAKPAVRYHSKVRHTAELKGGGGHHGKGAH